MDPYKQSNHGKTQFREAGRRSELRNMKLSPERTLANNPINEHFEDRIYLNIKKLIEDCINTNKLDGRFFRIKRMYSVRDEEVKERHVTNHKDCKTILGMCLRVISCR